MKTAIVTGASSGIGFEIAKKLISMKYKVYGIGRDFSKIDFNDSNFIKFQCDINKTSKLVEIINNIKNQEEVYILVNNAGVGYFGPHEELNSKKIHEMVSTNLEVPMILCQLLLRTLKKTKGYIINVSSITAKISSAYGCAYSATKAGISHFTESLFDETRKTGIKVITIHPDMTESNFYRNANFETGDLEDSFITPMCVADVVESILNQREGTVITDVTIKPQKHMIKRKKPSL